MMDESDFIMRPVLRGLCRYESLMDGSLNLEDIERMNDAIDCDEENKYRAAEAVKNSGRRP